MKHIPSFLKYAACVALTTSLLPAADNQRSTSVATTKPPAITPASGNAAQAWADVLTKATLVTSGALASKTSAEKNTESERQAAQSLLAAQAAKDFYTRFPINENAAAAKKVEAISLLRGVRAGDPIQEQAAVAVAQSYRLDPANSAKDRFDVALLLDGQDLSLKVAARTVANPAAEKKKLVEGWRAEFGPLPEIETYAVKVARRADPATAVALAAQVARSPVAPALARSEAQSLQARASLLGSSLSLKVPLVNGGEVDLGQPHGKVTVLVVWSPSEPDGLRALNPFKKGLPGGARLVCLAVGGAEGEVKRVRHTLPETALYGEVPAGKEAASAVAALRLRSAPYVYIVNRAGVLADFGPLSELPALLTRAGVTSRKTS